MDRSRAVAPRAHVDHHFLAAPHPSRDSYSLHVRSRRDTGADTRVLHMPFFWIFVLSLSDRAHDTTRIMSSCQGALRASLERDGGSPRCHGCSPTMAMFSSASTAISLPPSGAPGCSSTDWAPLRWAFLLHALAPLAASYPIVDDDQLVCPFFATQPCLTTSWRREPSSLPLRHGLLARPTWRRAF